MGRTGKITLGIVAVTVVALLAVGLTHRGDIADASIPLDGRDPLPRLVGKNLMTGATIDVASYRGKPLVINNWAVWCVPCKREAPVLKRFADRHPEIAIVGIAVNSDHGDAQKFQRAAGWSFPSIDDPDGALALTTLGITNLPATLFVDKDGILRGTLRGEITTKQLEDVASRLVG